MSVVPLDLADLSSVHTLSHNLVQQKQRLDIVICNAGLACFACPVIARVQSCFSPKLCDYACMVCDSLATHMQSSTPLIYSTACPSYVLLPQG